MREWTQALRTFIKAKGTSLHTFFRNREAFILLNTAIRIVRQNIWAGSAVTKQNARHKHVSALIFQDGRNTGVKCGVMETPHQIKDCLPCKGKQITFCSGPTQRKFQWETRRVVKNDSKTKSNSDV